MFPADSQVANVKAYGAVGDGVTDDTAAFQAAFTAKHKNSLIYVPDGTYLISDTIRWGRGQKRQILQGQSQGGTVIKLRDACPGYTDVAEPKAMIWTGERPAQRFSNGVRNLTLDTGQGNAGAIGAQFISNNQGDFSHVTIRSGDPAGVGVIGLDLGYTDEQGPCLIQHVSIEGFDTGIFLKHAVDGVVMEHITLRGQHKLGIDNGGQCLSIRGLDTELDVTALRNVNPGVVALIDSTLMPASDDAEPAVIVNEGKAGLMVRNVETAEDAVIRESDKQKDDEVATDGRVDLYVSRPVLTLFDTDPTTLNLPIEETPQIPWGELDNWANVADFGPPEEIELIEQKSGKKVTRSDWTEPIQRAIDSGATTVYFPATGSFGFYGPVYVRGKVKRLTALRNTFPSIIADTRMITMYQEEHRPRWIIEDGVGPVVIEDLDSNYFPVVVEQRSKRPVVVRHHSIYGINTPAGQWRRVPRRRDGQARRRQRQSRLRPATQHRGLHRAPQPSPQRRVAVGAGSENRGRRHRSPRHGRRQDRDPRRVHLRQQGL